MTFKEFISALFEKWTCEHDWEDHTNYLEIEDFYTHKKTIVSETSTICKKCGKFKKVKSR
jgi:hypothetical protein